MAKRKQQDLSSDNTVGAVDGAQKGQLRRSGRIVSIPRDQSQADPAEQPSAAKKLKKSATSKRPSQLTPQSASNTLTTAKPKLEGKGKAPGEKNALTTDPLHDLTAESTVQVNSKSVQLIAHLQVSPDPDHFASRKKLQMDFYLDSTETKDIGHIIAFIVSKTTATAAGTPAWISDFLLPISPENEDENETGVSFRELFTQAGKPRAKVKEHAAALQADEIIYLDGFELHGKGQKQGLSTPALQLFEDVLVAGGWKGTIVLSPAKPADKHGAKSLKSMTAVQIEEVLVKVYRKAGYGVWVQGPQDKEGSVTVMGKVVGEGDGDEDDD